MISSTRMQNDIKRLIVLSNCAYFSAGKKITAGCFLEQNGANRMEIILDKVDDDSIRYDILLCLCNAVSPNNFSQHLVAIVEEVTHHPKLELSYLAANIVAKLCVLYDQRKDSSVMTHLLDLLVRYFILHR